MLIHHIQILAFPSFLRFASQFTSGGCASVDLWTRGAIPAAPGPCWAMPFMLRCLILHPGKSLALQDVPH